MWAPIDTSITKALLFALRALANFGLLALGFTFLLSFRSEVFEYNEGIGDLSMLEFLVLVALGFLAWRHVYYARRLGMGFWSGLAKLLRGIGYFSLWLLAICGLFTVVALEYGIGDINSVLSAHTVDDAVLKLIGYAVFLFSVYLSAPTGISTALTHSPVTTNNQEPT